MQRFSSNPFGQSFFPSQSWLGFRHTAEPGHRTDGVGQMGWSGTEENIDCVYMLEHSRVMNVSNDDWIHVNRFIRSSSDLIGLVKSTA